MHVLDKVKAKVGSVEECPGRGELARWQIETMLAHVESALGAPIAVDELARLVGLSTSRFHRRFKASFGTSPQQFLVGCRLARAKVMMRDLSESLAQIACMCGFADQPHLTRMFRRSEGVTPGRWRRENCVENALAQQADAERGLPTVTFAVGNMTSRAV